MSLPLTTPPKSICILRLSAIGDVTHVLPTVRSIQHQWPETQITWIIGKLELQLVKDIPGIEFIVFNKSEGWSAYQKLKQQLKDRRFDVLLHMQISLRASIASLFIKAPIRIGYDRARAKNLQWLFTNHKIKAENTRQHVLDSFLEFAHALGVKQDIIRWDIPLSDDDKQFLQQLHPEIHNYAVINACTSARVRNWRNWSVESYARVIDYLYEHYQLVTVLTGGPNEMETGYALEITQRARHKPVDMVGKTTLKQLLAILDQARLVIAPDTGPVHMASACGTPTVGLYASSNPLRTGPYSQLDHVVNTYPQALLQETGETVEQAKWGQRVRNPEVMNTITVDAVIQQINALFEP